MPIVCGSILQYPMGPRRAFWKNSLLYSKTGSLLFLSLLFFKQLLQVNDQLGFLYFIHLSVWIYVYKTSFWDVV